jgi:hypothetical protein
MVLLHERPFGRAAFRETVFGASRSASQIALDSLLSRVVARCRQRRREHRDSTGAWRPLVKGCIS